jgi:phosphate starvation-inducible membrane PsiE
VFGCFAVVGGFVTSKFYVIFHKASWVNLTFKAAVFYPLILLVSLGLIKLSDPLFFDHYSGEDITLTSVAFILVVQNLLGTSLGSMHFYAQKRAEKLR